MSRRLRLENSPFCAHAETEKVSFRCGRRRESCRLYHRRGRGRRVVKNSSLLFDAIVDNVVRHYSLRFFFYYSLRHSDRVVVVAAIAVVGAVIFARRRRRQQSLSAALACCGHRTMACVNCHRRRRRSRRCSRSCLFPAKFRKVTLDHLRKQDEEEKVAEEEVEEEGEVEDNAVTRCVNSVSARALAWVFLIFSSNEASAERRPRGGPAVRRASRRH